MKRYEREKIGWVVKATTVPTKTSASKTITLSRNMSSESAANTFAELARRDVQSYMRVWVEDNYT